MSTSLYDATIPSYLQILGSVGALVDKAEAFCGEKGLAHEEIVMARLHEDMLPFSYQVKCCADHSLGAVEGVRAGNYSPSMAPPPKDFATLRTRIADAQTALRAISADEINALAGRDMQFSMNTMKIPFTAENFLYSFSLPNFYFHAATAYDILRHKGLKIGKMDFMGALRVKR
jgi:uncharacterized protein